MLTAEQLIQKTFLVIGGYRHKWHAHTVTAAAFNKQLCTGIGQEDLILQYKQRETDAQKHQRIRLTHTRTKSASNKIKSVFNRVFEVDKLKETIEFEQPNDTNTRVLRERISKFRGKRNLEQYLNDAVLYYNLVDANAFLLIGYTAPTNQLGDITENPVSFPIEIPSANVADFEYQTNSQTDLEYFITCEKLRVAEHGLLEYYSYSKGLQIYTVEFKPDSVGAEFYPPDPDLIQEHGEKQFAIYITEVVTQEVPAMRFGYLPDYKTNRETFVSILDAAEFEFRDLINRKSEYDISLALHTFLQKLQFAEPCEYQDGNDTCINGRMSISQDVCGSCNGTGLQIHTTAQQTLLVKRSDTKEGFVSLADMIHYVNMPFDIVKHQAEIVEKLPKDISIVIFGVDISERPNSQVTATAISNYYDSVYAVLAEFAAQYSSLFKFSVQMIAEGAGLADGLTVEHKFPSDFELYSLGELLGILDAAKKASAPDEVIKKIEQDILSKQNQDNPLNLQLFKIKRDFKPFKNLSEPVLISTLNSLPNTDTNKILYLYNDVIFSSIAKTKPNFIAMPVDMQKEIVLQQVQIVREQITGGEAVTFRDAVAESDTPGEEQEQEETEETETGAE